MSQNSNSPRTVVKNSQISTTRTITTIAMLCALSYVAVAVGRIPVVLFLKYDPKDVIITIGGFIWGPAVSLITSLIVSLIEMFTISDNGIWGLVMNVISTCAFACTAAFIYKKIHTLKGALIGLIAGCITMTALMMLWNYVVSPIYMGVPRSEVVKLLIPAFLPFNLIKSSLNAAITFCLYKPVVTALRKAGLVRPLSVSASVSGDGASSAGSSAPAKRQNAFWFYIIAALVVITCVLLILSYNKVI